LITSAIGSASALQPSLGAAAPGSPAETQATGDGFESILKSMATGTIDALRNGETTAIAAIEGKASTQQAVMATMQAEQSLQAALAIRDKIVSAFLEISRMQI
jgi:flagellar hook-basal body complex protein FliE